MTRLLVSDGISKNFVFKGMKKKTELDMFTKMQLRLMSKTCLNPKIVRGFAE